MANVALLKPNTAGAAILATHATDQGTIGSLDNAGGDSGVKIFMKLQSANIVTGAGVAETTGDGDVFRHFEHNEMLQGQAQLTGWVVSKPGETDVSAIGSIGIANLRTSSNPVSVALFIGKGLNTSDAATNRYLVFKMVIQQMNIQYNRTGAFIGLSVAGPMTDSYNVATYASRDLIEEVSTPVIQSS